MSSANETVRPYMHVNIMMTGEDVGADEEVEDAEDDLFAKESQEDAEAVRAEETLDETVDEHPEDVEEAADAARVLPDPGEPTPCQVEEHRASGHVPFRSWCRHCVEGRATGEQHRKRTGSRSISVFSFDYLFLDAAGKEIKKTQQAGDDEEGDDAEPEADVKILVAKDSLGKAVFAHVVPQKGIDAKNYAVGLLINDLKWLGYQKVSLRSDNERAIVRLLKNAATEARFEIKELEQLIEEHPNAYDSSGNGEIEATVKQVSGILRTNKLDLESRLGKKLPQQHPMFTWMVEHAAWIINVRTTGEDGKTAYERVRGRGYAKRLLPIGETVLVHLPAKGPERATGGAMGPRAKEALFIGYGKTSHSYVVYANGSVSRYRSIQRMSLSQRWSAQKVQEVDVSVADAHHHGDTFKARPVPLVDREAEEVVGTKKSRQARRIELRQAELAPPLAAAALLWQLVEPTMAGAARRDGLGLCRRPAAALTQQGCPSAQPPGRDRVVPPWSARCRAGRREARNIEARTAGPCEIY